MASCIWGLTLLRGEKLAGMDISGTSDPFVRIYLCTAKFNEAGDPTNISLSNKTKSPTVKKTVNPEWNYEAYSLPSLTIKKYQGLKFICYDKDSLSDDIIGEGFLWFNDQLTRRAGREVSVTLYHPSSAKKEKRKSQGSLVVKTSIKKSQAAERRRSVPATHSLNKQGSSSRGLALQRSELVQLSASGKKEVKVPTSGPQKFVSYSELPKLPLEQSTSDKMKGKYNFNPITGLWLVNCCTLAYKKKEYVRAVCLHVWDMCGFKFIDNQETDTQGFCMHNEEYLVVCFRGTESARDWITNLNFQQIPPPQLPERYRNSGVLFHTGFNDALMSVYGEVKEFIESALSAYPDLKIFLCGHSLGGAVANLCFGNLVLSDSPTEIEAVYTIGQPRAGNKNFRDQLKMASPNTTYIRLTNGNDCVPHLAGGQHCGIRLHFDPEGKVHFNPQEWQKAVIKMKSLKGAAASLELNQSFADHSGPVYHKKMSAYWLRSEFSKIGNDASGNSYDTCERILFAIDALQEDVKSVVRYKVQFRSLLTHVLRCRPLILLVEDFLVAGVDEDSNLSISTAVVTLLDLLSKFRDAVLKRQKKLSFLQKRDTVALEQFNVRITSAAKEFQFVVSLIGNTLQRASPIERDISAHLGSAPSFPVFSEELIDTIGFDRFDATGMTRVKVATSDKRVHVSSMIEDIENMVEEGKLEQALKAISSISTGKLESTVGVLDSEDQSLLSFLEAKAHAKLQHHEEAIKALGMISETSKEYLDDEAFALLKNEETFAELATERGTVKSVFEMNNFELHTLHHLFDSADTDGDNFLTTAELGALLNTLGIESILDNLGWIQRSTSDAEKEKHDAVVAQKEAIFTQILEEIRTKYRDAATVNQFIHLMSRFLPE